jgi:hypothetical protein
VTTSNSSALFIACFPASARESQVPLHGASKKQNFYCFVILFFKKKIVFSSKDSKDKNLLYGDFRSAFLFLLPLLLLLLPMCVCSNGEKGLDFLEIMEMKSVLSKKFPPFVYWIPPLLLCSLMFRRECIICNVKQVNVGIMGCLGGASLLNGIEMRKL